MGKASEKPRFGSQRGREGGRSCDGVGVVDEAGEASASEAHRHARMHGCTVARTRQGSRWSTRLMSEPACLPVCISDIFCPRNLDGFILLLMPVLLRRFVNVVSTTDRCVIGFSVCMQLAAGQCHAHERLSSLPTTIQTKRIYCITKDRSAAPDSVRDRLPLFASQVQRNGGLES